MLTMILDVKTNDLVDFAKSAEHPSQPHPVQYCAKLIDADTAETMMEVNCYVKPTDWEVTPALVDRHGVTTEYAAEHGIPERDVVASFMLMAHEAHVIAGFNVDFHLRAIRTAMIRSGISKEDADSLAKTIVKVDIMRVCTPICKLPPTDKMMARGIKTFKPPTLPEATLGVLGIETPAVHDAQLSVEMATKLYLALNAPRTPVEA